MLFWDDKILQPHPLFASGAHECLIFSIIVRLFKTKELFFGITTVSSTPSKLMLLPFFPFPSTICGQIIPQAPLAVPL